MIQTVKVGDYTIKAEDSCGPGDAILRDGINYEKWVVDELRKFIPDGKGFLDIGASVGIHSIIAASIDPHTPIFAVEASDFNINLLINNVVENSLQDQIAILPFALSGTNRIIRCNTNSPNIAVTEIWDSEVKKYSSMKSALCLDNINLPEIDLIKIDVEGYEVEVLEGASRVMECRPRIIFEFAPKVTWRSGLAPSSFLQWFLDRDYQLTFLEYKPGMRKTFQKAGEALGHLESTSKWICDILAEPEELTR